MIGPEFLSTFRLKPIETIRDWEDARLWKLSFESEVYRRKRLAEEAVSRNVDEFPEQLTLELTLSEVVDLLGVLTDHFDRHFWYNESRDVIDEIRSRMQKQEFRNRDLVEEIGSKGYVSDILNRRKPLTLRTARIFQEFFDIPAEWLMRGYKLDPREVENFKLCPNIKAGKVLKKKTTQKKPDPKKLIYHRFFG